MKTIIFLLDAIIAVMSFGLSLSFIIENDYPAALGWFVAFLGFMKSAIQDQKY